MGRAFEYRKARKFKRWGNMAKTFTRIGREIMMAVKEHGPDPQANSRLRVLMQNAKAANMPKENVERAIKKASSKDMTDYKELVYEGYGPHGIAIIVETATDNPTRTVASVRSIFNKYGGSLGTFGSVSFMFEHNCIFKVTAKPDIDLDELELEMIDYGAQEVFTEDESIIISGRFEDFGGMHQYLDGHRFDIESAEFERIPTQTKQLSPGEIAEVEKLLEKLEENDDVTNVFHNISSW